LHVASAPTKRYKHLTKILHQATTPTAPTRRAVQKESTNKKNGTERKSRSNLLCEFGYAPDDEEEKDIPTENQSPTTKHDTSDEDNTENEEKEYEVEQVLAARQDPITSTFEYCLNPTVTGVDTHVCAYVRLLRQSYVSLNEHHRK
jgi:hypothetical protein